MNSDLLPRFLLVIAITIASVGAYLLFNRRTLARATNKIQQFSTYQKGLPAILYFTTPTCAPCKTVQRPTIERLRAAKGKWFQVIEVDASTQPNIAQEWGVLSVPTTFIIDSSGAPKYVNHGVTNASKLIAQLEIEDYSI